MFKTEDVKIHFVIEDENIIFESFNDYIWLINDLLGNIYKKLKTKEREEEKISLNNKPEIVSIGNGCIWIDVVIPILCATIPIAYDIIKAVINSYNTPKINYNQTNSTVTLKGVYNYKKKQQRDFNDEKLFVKKIVNIFVKRQRKISDVDFVNNLPNTLKKYGFKSLICKVKNTKSIFDELSVANSLQTTKLSHYSKRHMNLTLQELRLNP